MKVNKIEKQILEPAVRKFMLDFEKGIERGTIKPTPENFKLAWQGKKLLDKISSLER